MKFVLFSVFFCLNLWGQMQECPEGSYLTTIYNNCRASGDRICALWYSKEICVKNPLICTMDIGPWGHPSACICGNGFFYNPIIGKCRLKDDFPCSKDINEWGNPSYCLCDEGFSYNPSNGNCSPVY